MPRSNRLIAALISIAFTSGCLLAEEDCGIGFVFEGDRCIPAEPAPPFRTHDGGPMPADTGGPVADAAAVPEPDDWAGYRIALIIDRTALQDASQTPASPGADIDAIQVIETGPRGDTRIGVANAVLGALFNDPFQGNLNREPEAVLGVPDGRAASLGTNGGFIYADLDLQRPLRRGDVLVVTERLEPSGRNDTYLLYLCRTPDSIDDCRELGDGLPGTTRFVLE